VQKISNKKLSPISLQKNRGWRVTVRRQKKSARFIFYLFIPLLTGISRLIPLFSYYITFLNDAEAICNTYGRRGVHFLRPIWEEYQEKKHWWWNQKIRL